MWEGSKPYSHFTGDPSPTPFPGDLSPDPPFALNVRARTLNPPPFRPRSNLDPWGEHADVRLWEALQAVQLSAAVSQLAGGLTARMDQGGDNLSVCGVCVGEMG